MAKNNLKRLKIAYACNDKMYKALLLSILSIVKRTKNPIDFYLFTADLREIKKNYIPLKPKHQASIQNIIKKYNPNSTFTILDCKKKYYDRSNNVLPDTKHWTPYTAFRLLFDLFPNINGKILYLDTDTMLCDDVSKVFDVNMNNLEMVVTKDIINRLNKKYFNAGVLLMNMDFIRKTRYFEKAFKYLLEKKPEYCDQDALNITGKFIKFRSDDRFNRIYEKRTRTTVIKHFAGPCIKPWQRKFKKTLNVLNYGIWEDDIIEWKKIKCKI